jgi:hypothetical protein
MGQSQRATRSCTPLVRTVIIAATFREPCPRVGPGSAADGRPGALIEDREEERGLCSSRDSPAKPHKVQRSAPETL